MMHPRVCYEGDGGAGGGGFFDSIKNLFGGATQTAPTTSSLSLGELSPQQLGGLSNDAGGTVTGFDVPVGGQDPTGSSAPLGDTAGGLNIPLTGAVQPGSVPTGTGPTPVSNNLIQTLQGPGAGIGAVAGPGAGAAGSAAPASVTGADLNQGAITSEALPAPAGANSIAPRDQISSIDVARSNMDALARDPGVAPGAAGASGDSSIDKFLADPSGKGLLKALGTNANILLPAAGLGWQALQAQKAPEGLNNIRSAADQTSTQSKLLESYLTSGQLPPGLQAGLDQAKEAAKASIRSRYANLPGSSSAMEQELANADQMAASQGGQLAIQLFSQGMTEANVSNQLYEAILQQSLERDKELSGAVGNFSTALAGGGPSVKLSLA